MSDTDARTLKERAEAIDRQVRDVADYLCSRGDSMPMRSQVEGRVRRTLHALAIKGWIVTRKDAEND